jgi:hypothetical protein
MHLTLRGIERRRKVGRRHHRNKALERKSWNIGFTGHDEDEDEDDDDVSH